MSPAPVVLFPLTLPALLHHVLAAEPSGAPTVLIICSSQAAFLEDLLQSLRHHHGKDDDKNLLQDLIAPTLYNLSTTRHVKLAFCASVQALLAYLTAYGHPPSGRVGATDGAERLVLVNPLAMHGPTTSFSAQGLSRTFAAATETALRTGAVLYIVECQGQRKIAEEHNDEDDDAEMVGDHEQDDADAEAESDPWDQEVSILNVSARRFGSASGERAWAGRTVKARRIAGRWFQFQRLEIQKTRDELG